MHYPEQERAQQVLRYFYRVLQRQYSAGYGGLNLLIMRNEGEYDYTRVTENWRGKTQSGVASGFAKAGVYVCNTGGQPTNTNIAQELNLRPVELVMLLARLEESGYVDLRWASYLAKARGSSVWEAHTHSPTSAPRVWVNFVTEAGLVYIGELPDPQAQLIRGFEAAIEAIKHDRSLTDREKRQKINWLQEGTVIARTLS